MSDGHLTLRVGGSNLQSFHSLRCPSQSSPRLLAASPRQRLFPALLLYTPTPSTPVVSMDTHWRDYPITVREMAAAPLLPSFVRSLLPHQPSHHPVRARKTNNRVGVVMHPNKPSVPQGPGREGGPGNSKGKNRFKIPKVRWLCVSHHLVRNNGLRPFQKVLATWLPSMASRASGVHSRLLGGDRSATSPGSEPKARRAPSVRTHLATLHWPR